MNCKDFKELLSAYADGELSLTQREFIEEHLINCPNCRAIVNDYKAVNLKIASLRETPAMPDIKGTTMARIKGIQPAKHTRKWLQPVPVSLYITIIISVIALFIWAFQPSDKIKVIKLTMPIYGSIEQLSDAPNLDAVVTGTVKDIAGYDTNKGIPLIFYTFEVSDMLFGTIDETIIISLIDTSSKTKTSLNDYVTPFAEGEQLLLFLGERDSSSLSCGSPFYHFYSPISYDNGVFDILPDGIVSPRMQWAFKPIGGTDEPITIALDEIRGIVTNNN
jgi:lipoprotein signal peptidase